MPAWAGLSRAISSRCRPLSPEFEACCKSSNFLEIRNPKSEVRKKSETRTPANGNIFRISIVTPRSYKPSHLDLNKGRSEDICQAHSSFEHDANGRLDIEV